MSYWQNYKKFMVSFLKSMWGKAATPENDFAYQWLPKLDVPGYDMLRTFDLMHQGKVNGYFCQGFNPLLSLRPTGARSRPRLSKLKFLVVMDPLQTETARFWKDEGVHNDVKPEAIQTEVFELPTTCFAEDEGSLVNSGRWLQWHWPGAEPPGQAKTDAWIMAQLHMRLRELYRRKAAPSRTRSSICTGATATRRPTARRDRQGVERLRRLHRHRSGRSDQGACWRRASRSTPSAVAR
jgi:formate dehydrogenase major subunit